MSAIRQERVVDAASEASLLELLLNSTLDLIVALGLSFL